MTCFQRLPCSTRPLASMPVDIPQEILDMIIGYLPAPYFLDSASFVSHTFHQIVLPYKFRSLTFQVESNIRDELDRTTHITIPKFCEAINTGDAHALSLAPLVQELSLLYWSGKDWSGNLLMLEPFEKVLNSVSSFRNLKKLTMNRCVTSPTIMEQLGNIVQLQSLHTWRCYDEGYGDGYHMELFQIYNSCTRSTASKIGTASCTTCVVSQ